jgi:hypothetical protein
MPSVRDTFPAAWGDYKRRVRALLIVLAALVPSLLVGTGLARAADSSTPVMVSFLIWAVAMMIVWTRLYEWRCPQCGEAFHYRRVLGGFG